jgi:hypothetical protein
MLEKFPFRRNEGYGWEHGSRKIVSLVSSFACSGLCLLYFLRPHSMCLRLVHVFSSKSFSPTMKFQSKTNNTMSVEGDKARNPKTNAGTRLFSMSFVLSDQLASRANFTTVRLYAVREEHRVSRVVSDSEFGVYPSHNLRRSKTDLLNVYYLHFHQRHK